MAIQEIPALAVWGIVSEKYGHEKTVIFLVHWILTYYSHVRWSRAEEMK